MADTPNPAPIPVATLPNTGHVAVPTSAWNLNTIVSSLAAFFSAILVLLNAIKGVLPATTEVVTPPAVVASVPAPVQAPATTPVAVSSSAPAATVPGNQAAAATPPPFVKPANEAATPGLPQAAPAPAPQPVLRMQFEGPLTIKQVP